MPKYTMTVKKDHLRTFNQVLGRLGDDEFTIVTPLAKVKEEDYYSDYSCVIETEPEACLTFRMGVPELKIRRERTEEELAEEKALEDRHKIKVTVHVPQDEYDQITKNNGTTP